MNNLLRISVPTSVRCLLLQVLCILPSAYSQAPLLKLWDYGFGGNDIERLFCFEQTADGGYILGGHSWSGISGNKTQPNWDSSLITTDYWIVKIDASGNKQWDKDFGGTGSDLLYSVQQVSDGGYILGGWSQSDSSGDKTQPTWGGYDFWFVKIDSLGNKQWDKDFGYLGSDRLQCVLQTSDGGFMLGGYSISGIGGDKTAAPRGSYDYWMIKTDMLGNKLWDKAFGGQDGDNFSFHQQLEAECRHNQPHR